MEQRAQRARNALLSGHMDAAAASAPSTWNQLTWNAQGLHGAGEPLDASEARLSAGQGGAPPTAAARPSTDLDATAAALGLGSPEERPTEEAELVSKRARPLDNAQPALDAIRELHPQFRHDAPIVLDAALPFVLEQPAPSPSPSTSTSTSLRKLRPEQEKARASFVAQHAGQTYEQMVLEHAYSSDRLYWLKEAYNLTWRTGRWSQDEEDRATAALDKFCKHHKLSQGGLDELIWHRKPEQKQLHEELWKHIALSVGTRPNYAVRMHIKSMRKDVLRGGHWTPDDVAALASAVAELGHQWEKIGTRLGRSGNVCKHFWREQMQSRKAGPAPQGAFRPEEEEALRRTVLACCEEVGCAPDGPNLPWTLIHERLGPSPRRISVLSRKWRGMLSADRRLSDEQNARWYAPRDDHVLLSRIRAQRKHSAADIEFDKLATPDWQWPLYVIKKHWVVMLRKRIGPDFHGSLDELLDTLDRQVPSPDEYKMLASGRRPGVS